MNASAVIPPSPIKKSARATKTSASVQKSPPDGKPFANKTALTINNRYLGKHSFNYTRSVRPSKFVTSTGLSKFFTKGAENGIAIAYVKNLQETRKLSSNQF